MIKKFIDKLLSKADSVRPRKPRFGKRGNPIPVLILSSREDGSKLRS
mgnify:CR=1 FL=1